MKNPCIYILTNKARGTLYIGVTSNLVQRIWQHKHNQIEGFTAKYQLHRLVYFEQFEEMTAAIQREKQLKKWHRQWKIALIEKDNNGWRDLYLDFTA